MGPLKQAVACLGPAKIVPSPGGRGTLNTTHAWTLNGFTGMTFTGGWHLEAQMHYRFLLDDALESGPWRVTTEAYRYRLAMQGEDLFRIHWHPAGNSAVTYPHLHAALAGGEKLANSLDAHLRMPRMAFEDAIRWALELGVPASRPDWSNVLDSSVKGHLEHRSWH